MPLRHKTMRSHADGDEKRLFQGLVAAELAKVAAPEMAETLHHDLQQRQKRSSATLLRRKLSQAVLKREYQDI